MHENETSNRPAAPLPATKTLILGGARSGKSALAESRAGCWHGRVIYLATATAADDEMERRIAHHQSRRPASWALVETPLELAQAIAAEARPDTCLLVDCLTLWLTNLLFASNAANEIEAGQALTCRQYHDALQALEDAVRAAPGQLLLVSNEVGWGIVPMQRLSRAFADEQGRLNQRVARCCDEVLLVAAGLPLTLKAPPLG